MAESRGLKAVILCSILGMTVAASGQQYVAADLGSVPYVPLAAPTTPLTLYDETQVYVPIGFTFTFYGTAYSNIYVHANGFLNFTGCGGAGCYTPAVIPTAAAPNALIANCWLDLNPAGTGVAYKTEGNPPNRTFSVEFSNVAEWSAPANRHTFKTVLYEVDSSIEYFWGPSSGSVGAWTCGAENQAGTSGVGMVGTGFGAGGTGPGTWPSNRGGRIELSLDPDLTVSRITPSSSTPGAGSMVSVEVEVRNGGAGAVPSVRVDLFANPPAQPPLVGTLTCGACAYFGSQTIAVPAGPGGTAVANFTGLTSATPGGWSFYAIVDNNQMVTEFNEANNVAGPTGIFWAGTLSMPFFDDFEGGMNLTIDPLMPSGGVVCGNCGAPPPCRLARGAIRSGFQSLFPPSGNSSLVLDSIHRGSATSWPGSLLLSSLDNPLTEWETVVPEHHGSATVTLDTAGYTQLTLEFDFNFVVNLNSQSQFTVEIDDGTGWRIPVGPSMNGPFGNTYIPDECAVCSMTCPGCAGFYNDQIWTHETIDLSSFSPGPAFSIRFRYIVRHNFDGAGCGTFPNAVLIDNMRVDGITMGLTVTAPFPPGQFMVNADEIGLDATPFRIASVMQSSTYDRITLAARGSGDDSVDVADLQLYEDADGSLTYTAGDVLIGSTGGPLTMDEGSFDFLLPAPVMLASGQGRNYIAVLDLAGSASGLETFRIDVTGVRMTSPAGAMASGLPRHGATMTVQLSDLTVSLGPNNPPSVAGIIGQVGAVISQLRFASAASATRVDQVILDAVGSGNDMTGITEVRIVKENPGTTNGLVDAGEPVLFTGVYASDNATLAANLSPPLSVGIVAPAHLLVVYDFSLTATAPGMMDNYCFRIDTAGDIRSDALTTMVVGLPITQCATVRDTCPRTLCGDCNLDGLVNILDALVAAQHAASVLMPPLSGSRFSNCNASGALEPSPTAAVNILDALVIAQRAAGLSPTFACC